MNYPLEFQQQIFETLEKLASGGRFPHALIFEGPAGSGKKTAARYAASLLLCRENGVKPCGQCRSCKKQLENHPDFTVIEPKNKSKTISVDQIRDIKLSAYVAPHEADRKVYFIPDAHQLRVEAQNALLKLIEEPPEAARFILTVPSRSNLLETVISRSTVIPMRQLEQQQRLEVLKSLSDKKYADQLQQLSQDCLTVGEALAALSDPDAMKLSKDADELLKSVISGKRYDALILLCRYEKDREQYIKLFNTLRGKVISTLCRRDSKLSALRANKIIDIIDKTVFSATQNAALSLLSAASANRLIAAALSALK